MLALVILTMALLGLAASGTFAQRQVTRARGRSEAMEQARIQLEELLGQPYDSLRNGSSEASGVKMEWTVSDLGSNKQILLVYEYDYSGEARIDTVAAALRSR